jgi:microcystin-dependent protein
MPTLDFPDNPSEADEWRDNDDQLWVFWRGAWVSVDNYNADGTLTAIGTIRYFGGLSVPEGYLKCDGSEVPREAYSDLYEAIGDTFGDGDGSTTFNLPDMGGRLVQGGVIGEVEGETEQALTPANLPAHQHNVTMNAVPAHSHSGSVSSRSGSASFSGSASSSGAHSHQIRATGAFRTLTDNAGGTPAHFTGSITTQSAGNHTHSVSGSYSTGAGGSNNFTTGAGAGHTPSGSLANKGGGLPLPIMQPFMPTLAVIKY